MYMKKLIYLFVSCCLASAGTAQTDALYGTGRWNADSLGNHRVVLEVTKPADAVLAEIPWRRKDVHPEAKDLIVVDAATGREIPNRRRYAVNREYGELVFQPVTVPGEYYVYYLQNRASGSTYYPTVTYTPYRETASPEWLRKNNLDAKKLPRLPKAGVKQFQSIDGFNSFYPMEVIATAAETDRLLRQYPHADYLLFPEDRAYPIRMTTDLPWKWMRDERHGRFEGIAKKGEYYTFQIGVWAARRSLDEIRVAFSDLTDVRSGVMIPASAFTCFNTEGTDVYGQAFEKVCSVAKGRVQPLWMGVQVPGEIRAGQYTGFVTVSGKDARPQEVAVTLTVSGDAIADAGDNEPWRHSRLRWLNSQIGFDDEVVAPYTPLQLDGNTISCLGRTVELSPLGFPRQITSYFTERMTGIGTEGRALLASPVTFVTEGAGDDWKNLDFAYTERKHGVVAWKTLNRNTAFLMQCEARMEFDGCLTYGVTLVAQKDIAVSDIRLEAPLAPGIARYMMGLGQKGGYCPECFRWKWSVEKNQDGPWVGDVNAGMQLRFTDENYRRPLNTNFYHQQPLNMPPSWYNGGKGGIDLASGEAGMVIRAYSGDRQIKEGEVFHYNFTLTVTPFRPVDVKKHWRNRYYHSYDFIDKVDGYGANVVNVHHATPVNPYINYPFLRPAQMKAYIDGAHALDKKVKIYNTVRELSNHATELFALRSLGDEIFSRGNGGGFSWLQEHLDQDYIAAWFAPNVKDAAIVNSGISRWHNYYLEGLNWLVRHVGIDGLYIDDLAFDRSTMKRVRKILNSGNPGALIDLHSANQFNPKDGFANSANLYLEHLAFIDRIWFGEYFDYNLPPDFWLIEVSGIPYGLMGEMLQDGGNPWRGMLYGITQRAPWSGDPRAVWKVWDDFGILDSEMIGYWVKDNPVQTGREKTPATVYVRTGERALIAVATWENADTPVTLSVDWKALGLDPATVTLYAPAVENFQQEATYKPDDTILVPKGKGLLLIAE